MDYLRIIESNDDLTKTIMLKLRILKFNLFIVVSYSFTYIFGNYSINYKFMKADTIYNDWFNSTLDIIMLVLTIINLRSRRLLYLYEGVSFNFIEFNSIFNVKIKSKNINKFYEVINEYSNKKVDLMLSQKMSKNDDSIDKENFAVMIINPLIEKCKVERFSRKFSNNINDEDIINNSTDIEGSDKTTKASYFSMIINNFNLGKVLSK